MSAVNEYWAFIQPLRDNPDDETARLAYTDWLDERSDPRADYLRTEAAWATLQPGDEQYRPLYRRVSELAVAVDPEWFTSVSRVAHLVRQRWLSVEPPFISTALPAPEQASEWKETSTVLRTLFAEAFGAQEVARRFCLPADFTAFMCAVEGFHYSRSELIEITKWHIEEFADPTGGRW